MINLKLTTTAAAALLLLNACSSDSTTTTTTSGTDISVIGVSGVPVVLSGTYSTGCYGTNGGSVLEGLVISGNTWNYTQTSYTDGACSAGAVVSTAAATLTASADQSITGWFDGNASAAAPTAADGSGPLSDTEPFTPLLLTVTNVTGSFVGQVAAGDTSPLFYVVDDTGVNNILYRDVSYDTGSLNALTVDFYTMQ